MQNTESELVRREKEAILYSLSSLKPFFEDPNVTDIFVDNGNVSVKEFGKELHDVNITLSNQQCKNIIVQIANHMGITIDYINYPVLEGTVPYYDARITGILNWVKNPFITIRKRPTVIYTFDDYVKNKQCSQENIDKIKHFIKFRKNILISGGTGSGKTTFTNACIKQMEEYTPNARFFIVEDNAELQTTAKYAQKLTIKTEEAMSAIKLSLRCSPDRIIFGEIRDGDVLWSLLDGFNTGHPGGISTIHSNSAQGTLKRMRTLLTQAHKPDVPVDGLIDLIVHLSRSEETGIVVDEILETNNHDLY